LKKKEYFVSFIDFYIDFKGIFQNQKNKKNKDFVLLLIFASFLKAFSEIKIKQKSTIFCLSSIFVLLFKGICQNKKPGKPLWSQICI
tara:strand:+ start:271 stop:531 length:261 start_codon:yes stop_codon:yes gene_type:complete